MPGLSLGPSSTGKCLHPFSGSPPQPQAKRIPVTPKPATERAFLCVLKYLCKSALTKIMMIRIVDFIAGSHRQQAGDSPATTARGKPGPSPLTGTDWLSNESSLKNGHFHCCTWLAGCNGKTTEANRDAMTATDNVCDWRKCQAAEPQFSTQSIQGNG